MKRFRLEINTESPAFKGEPEAEIARVLDWLSFKMKKAKLRTNDSGPVKDINGNQVGTWEAE